MPPHPAVVHFPIAFLLLAAALHLVRLRSSSSWVAYTARLCGWLGMASLAVAVLTGQASVPTALAPAVVAVLEQHQRFGFLCLLWYGGLTLWEMARHRRMSLWESIALAVGHLMGALAIGVTAYLGGRLVYEFGLGVRG